MKGFDGRDGYKNRRPASRRASEGRKPHANARMAIRPFLDRSLVADKNEVKR